MDTERRGYYANGSQHKSTWLPTARSHMSSLYLANPSLSSEGGERGGGEVKSNCVLS